MYTNFSGIYRNFTGILVNTGFLESIRGNGVTVSKRLHAFDFESDMYEVTGSVT